MPQTDKASVWILHLTSPCTSSKGVEKCYNRARGPKSLVEEPIACIAQWTFQKPGVLLDQWVDNTADFCPCTLVVERCAWSSIFKLQQLMQPNTHKSSNGIRSTLTHYKLKKPLHPVLSDQLSCFHCLLAYPWHWTYKTWFMDHMKRQQSSLWSH